MRLLILCEYPTLLGGERSMLATLPALADAGFDVNVAAPSNGPLAAALTHRGVPHFAWQTHDAHGQRLPLDQLRTSLAGRIERLRPALIHANSLSTSRIAGPIVAEKRVPSVGHLRDIVKLAPQAITDINCHHGLLAVSHATRDFHVVQGLDANKCKVTYNGVDLEEFAPRPATGYLHRELGIARTVLFVATIGQLGLRKATHVVFQAALQIASELPDVHWLIVGERTSGKPESVDYERQLHALAAEPPLVGRIHFLGSRSDVSRLLNECVLLVHAARQEPLGRVLLEAAASGLPIVATDVGGTREIFPTSNAGAVLVPPDNWQVLTQAVLSLLPDEPRRKLLAASAWQRAVTQFDIRRASERLIAQYRQILED